MGLDMFLDGIFEQDGENVREQVIYWRKSNQVHNWFVVNAQDGEDNCQPHSVSREQLEELRDLCRAVLADIQGRGTSPNKTWFLLWCDRL